MRACVATTVHHPEDARIMHRQIRALLDAGHEVTYVGAPAGLSLAADTVRTAPTKIMDYMGRGLPVITTPQGATLVERAGCGLVVPQDVDAVLNAVLDLKEKPERQARLGALGHACTTTGPTTRRPSSPAPSRGPGCPPTPWPSRAGPGRTRRRPAGPCARAGPR